MERDRSDEEPEELQSSMEVKNGYATYRINGKEVTEAIYKTLQLTRIAEALETLAGIVEEAAVTAKLVSVEGSEGGGGLFSGGAG